MIDLIKILAHITHIQHGINYVSPTKQQKFAEEFNKISCELYIYYYMVNEFFYVGLEGYNIQFYISVDGIDVNSGGTHNEKMTKLINNGINKSDPDELAILNFEFNSLIKMQKEGN